MLLHIRQQAVGLQSQLSKNFRGRVGGAVIQDDDLKVWIILRKHRRHTGADVARFVAGRDAHRNERRVGEAWRPGRLDDDIHLILAMQPMDDDHTTEEQEGGADEIDCHGGGKLEHFHGTAALGLFHFDARRESVFEFIEVGDDEDLGKIVFDEVDGFDQALTALHIL